MLLSAQNIRSLLNKRRGLIVFAFLLLQPCLGINYTFPAFSPVLIKDYGWKSTETSLVYSIISVCFGLGCTLSGRIVKKTSYRTLTVISAILLSSGFWLASFDQGGTFLPVLLGYGVLVGLSVGNSYIVSLACAVSYFPKSKGLITGLSIGSYGFGSLIWSLIGEVLLKENVPGYVYRVYGTYSPIGILLAGIFMVQKELPKQLETPVKEIKELADIDEENIVSSIPKSVSSLNLPVVGSTESLHRVGSAANMPRNASALSVLSELSLVGATELAMIDEHEHDFYYDHDTIHEDVEGEARISLDLDVPERPSQHVTTMETEVFVTVEREPEAAQPVIKVSGPVYTPITVKQTLSNTSFWLAFSAVTLAGSAGLMSMNALRIYPIPLLEAKGYSEEQISQYTFIALGVSFHLGNSIGRVLMGQIVDMTSAGLVWTLTSFLQGCCLVAFVYLSGNPVILAILSALIATFYGTIYVCLPVILSDLFGQINFATVFPLVFASVSVAGLLGPNLVGILMDMGYSQLPFFIAIFGMMVCVLLVSKLSSRVKLIKSI
ncbi:hypothetical protein RCL1_006590 [Eukaryota sp. TZLM3-RCL]